MAGAFGVVTVASVIVSGSPMGVAAHVTVAGRAWAPVALTGLGVTHPAESTTTCATTRSASFADAPLTPRNSDNRASFGCLHSHVQVGSGQGRHPGALLRPTGSP